MYSKYLYLECCCLWNGNMDRRRKCRGGRKWVWNVVLEKNVKNKMDRLNNEG
jgi:hypothetical protein